MITMIDLFSGIGGFSQAAREVFGDVDTLFFCEINKFGQNVLRKNFGMDSLIYEDIFNVTRERFIADTASFRTFRQAEDRSDEEHRKTVQSEGVRSAEGFDATRNDCPRFGTVDLLTGGFPCQPFSQAGKQKGTKDERHLWPEMLRVIQEFQPTWIIAENVSGILTIEKGMVFEQVCVDMENAGYEVQPYIIPACGVNAPHKRDRVWFIAHRKSTDTDGTGRWSGRCVEQRSRFGEPEATVGSGDRAAADTDNSGVGTRGCGTDGNRSQEVVEGNQSQLERSGHGCAVTDAGCECGKQGSAVGVETDSVERSAGYVHDQSSDCGCVSHAHAEGERRGEAGASVGRSEKRCAGANMQFDTARWDEDWREVAAATCHGRMDDGVPGRVVRLPDGKSAYINEQNEEQDEAFTSDGFQGAVRTFVVLPDGTKMSQSKWREEALKAFGNAIVPAVAVEIMKGIKYAMDNEHH